MPVRNGSPLVPETVTLPPPHHQGGANPPSAAFWHHQASIEKDRQLNQSQGLITTKENCDGYIPCVEKLRPQPRPLGTICVRAWRGRGQKPANLLAEHMTGKPANTDVKIKSSNSIGPASNSQPLGQEVREALSLRAFYHPMFSK